MNAKTIVNKLLEDYDPDLDMVSPESVSHAALTLDTLEGFEDELTREKGSVYNWTQKWCYEWELLFDDSNGDPTGFVFYIDVSRYAYVYVNFKPGMPKSDNSVRLSYAVQSKFDEGDDGLTDDDYTTLETACKEAIADLRNLMRV